MVSVVERSRYVNGLDEDSYITALKNFLLGDEISAPQDPNWSDANELALSALLSIQENDEAAFRKAYNRFSERNPKPKSPWLYNDVLIFAMVMGVSKYDLKRGWLLNLLSIRTDATDGEPKLISATLSDILEDNFANKSNCTPLLIVAGHLLNAPMIDKERLDRTFLFLNRNPFPYYESTFLNLVALRAAEVIVTYKGVVNLEERDAIDSFVGRFGNRTRQIAYSAWLIFTLFVAGLLVYLGYEYFSATGEEADWYEKFFDVLSIVTPAGLVSLLWWRDKLVAWVEGGIQRFFGYTLD